MLEREKVAPCSPYTPKCSPGSFLLSSCSNLRDQGTRTTQVNNKHPWPEHKQPKNNAHEQQTLKKQYVTIQKRCTSPKRTDQLSKEAKETQRNRDNRGEKISMPGRTNLSAEKSRQQPTSRPRRPPGLHNRTEIIERTQQQLKQQDTWQNR